MFDADDTSIFSNNAQGLQTGLACLYLYCNTWKLNVNVEETKIDLFEKYKWKGKHNYFQI